eukprot:scaffold3165_cov29-Tisochrysis_lutea.AAC.2
MSARESQTKYSLRYMHERRRRLLGSSLLPSDARLQPLRACSRIVLVLTQARFRALLTLTCTTPPPAWCSTDMHCHSVLTIARTEAVTGQPA